MNPVPAPPNTSVVGEHTLLEEEQHEKKPVLKKVKDKVKKIKNVISKKSHGNEGGNHDYNQQRELDEGDNEFQDAEEINEDIAVHGVPTSEGSAAGAGIVPQEISRGGRGEGTKGAGDVSDFINMDEFYQNQVNPKTDHDQRETRFQQNPEFENQSTGVRTGSPLTTEKFVGDLAPPTIEAEKNTDSEQSRAYVSPTSNVRNADNEISRDWGKGDGRVDDGLGVIKEESVENPAARRTEETYVIPAISASSGAKERSTGELKAGEISPRVNDNFGLITDDLTKDPTTPKADDEAKARDAWNQVHLSPTSSGARTGLNEMSEREVDDAKGLGDGLSLTTVELVEDLAAPKTEAEANTNTEQTRVGNEANISPDLCRSLDAMTLSPQNKSSSTNLPKSPNNSYTNMVSSAASKVYEMVSDAGTAVISKVKPVGTNDGEGDAAENQGKGISFTEYVKEKLTPGEDEKALSEVISEAGQRRRNEAVEAPPRREGEGKEEGERGVGVVGKIRESFSSLLGGGQSSPKSPQAESQRKVAEDNVDLHSRPSEAI